MRVDLECGSTTNNTERQKEVAFSPIMFVAGTKLLVKRGSPIQSFRDLNGKNVVVTAGTTNEAGDAQARGKIWRSISISSWPRITKSPTNNSPAARWMPSPEMTCCFTGSSPNTKPGTTWSCRRLSVLRSLRNHVSERMTRNWPTW